MKNRNKTITAIFPCIVLAFSLHAQTNSTPPSISWQKSLGGSGNDVANCAKPTSDGGFIIAGISNSNNGDITGNHGQNDFCLIKLNAAGNLVWQHSYGGTGVDEATCVVQTPDGGYAVAGKNSSHNGDVTGNHGSSDFWLIKTNDQGTLQWQKSYGGSQSELAYAMEPTSDGALVIAGITYSNNGDVSGNHGVGDAWIIKVDQNGNLLWQKAVGGSQLDIASDIKQTNDGGYIVTGYSLSNDGNISTNKGEEDFLFFKLDASGNLQWQKTMGGTGGDVGNAGVQSIDGGYVFCGLTHSTDLDVVGALGGHDVWVIKTDPAGTAQWTRCLGGSDTDEGIEIKQQTDGTIIVCGNTGSNNNDVSGLHGLYDIWLTALDTSGNSLWQKTLGGNNYDYPLSLQILSSGQYLVAGKTNSTNGDITENHGGYDFWVVKLNTVCNTIFYADADGDGYGSIYSSLIACSQPSGYVNDSTDCNDNPNQSGAAIHPGATEVSNGIDDDCNGIIDDEPDMEDVDRDEYTPEQGDCNDYDSAIHPGATEVCNGVDDNCNGQIDDGAVTATITPAGSVVICSGSTFTLFANTGAGLTYQWKKNGSNISGATSSLYNTKVAAEFSVIVSSGSCSATAAVTNVSVSSLPEATITPNGNVFVCPGISLAMNANTGDELIYQWQLNSINISGATGNSYTTSVAGSYKVIVTNSNGCSRASATTSLNNYSSPATKITVIGSLNICSAGSVILSAKVVSGYTYQWFKNNLAISAATGSTYTATQAGTYCYQATKSSGCTAISANKVVTSCRLENESNTTSLVSVYPNPANGNFNVELDVEGAWNGTARIELISMMGDVVLAEAAEVYEGTLLHKITMKQELPSALYFVRIIAGDRVFYHRILYQR
ncbi:MAG TPA: MopE-related protein [Chitinophagales bacterium]|nr:MopE-related protein [Chitinophagales bacterium]